MPLALKLGYSLVVLAIPPKAGRLVLTAYRVFFGFVGLADVLTYNYDIYLFYYYFIFLNVPLKRSSFFKSQGTP